MFPKQALSIGINAYSPSHLNLRPCIHDATDLHHSLRSIGFHTHCEADLDLNSMKSITHQFVRSIQPGAVVVFYFSGHGVQSDGKNYLIPTNATGICAENIKLTAIDAQKLVNSMHERCPRLIICILDCCRTDPPTDPLDGSGRSKRALAGTIAGFAPMQAPPSTIVVYACAADDTASPRSQNGRNSLYTYHLLRYIRTPDVDIETVLRYVAADVQKESDNEQVPFRYSSCNEMICLASQFGYKALLPHQYIDGRSVAHRSSKQHGKAVAIHHGQPRLSDFQYRWNGHFNMPTNRHSIGRNVLSHGSRVSLGHGSSSTRDLWHYRR